MKCSACHNNECERSYENRDKCLGEKEGVECTCSCQTSSSEKITRYVASVGAGIAAVSGGVALTFISGGFAAIIGGAAMIGAGSSLVMNPIQKQIFGECMTLADTLTDTAFGLTVGELLLDL